MPVDVHDSDGDVIQRWLASGQLARIAGLDLKPIPHPFLLGTPRCIRKGQAVVFFLEQHPDGGRWLLKRFAPGRRPSDAYVEAVSRVLPGGAAFFTCTQRRLLTARHHQRGYSRYSNPNLTSWLEGTVLMPAVPGSPWSAAADSLREGELAWSLSERIRAAIHLVDCVARLEAAGCSHRDLSGGNVFLEITGRVYLIDWDCLYHAQLPFQPNTTIGTLGYVAPFLCDPVGGWDASRSWCPHADRFAMAVLVAELLLVGPDAPDAREDGSLFAQAQLQDPHDSFVLAQVERLHGISKHCALQFENTLRASRFEACPSPYEWHNALKRAGRLAEARDAAVCSRGQSTRQACTNCGKSFWTNRTKVSELEARGRPILCSTCFASLHQAWCAARLERDQAYPQIVCDHCRRSFRVGRPKLEQLRAGGRPILCGACLPRQLKRWKDEHAEREREFPRTRCSKCGADLRVRRATLEALQARGKPVLCLACRPQRAGNGGHASVGALRSS